MIRRTTILKFDPLYVFAEKLITKIIKAEQISVRQIASIVKLIQSFKRDLGSVTRMYTRRTYCWMAAKLEIGYYSSQLRAGPRREGGTHVLVA